MSEIPPAEAKFLAQAEQRLGRWILILGLGGTPLAAWQWEARAGWAFFLGAGFAYLNYRWIVAVVDSLVRARRERLPRSAYLKLVLPMALLGLLLYAIFTCSELPPGAVLAGLSVLVGAVFLEAFWEILLAFGHHR